MLDVGFNTTGYALTLVRRLLHVACCGPPVASISFLIYSSVYYTPLTSQHIRVYMHASDPVLLCAVPQAFL